MLVIESYIIVIFILIWILLFVLSRVFFNPVQKVMRERKERLRTDRDSCERALDKSEQKTHEVEESKKSARALAHQTREEFEKEGTEEKNRLLEKVSRESRAQRDKEQKKLEAQVEDSKKKLESEAEILAEVIEKRLLHS